MRRLGQVTKGLLALGLLAGLLGGVPWALWRYVGWPLPHRVPSWSQLTSALASHGIPDEVLLKALACVVWIAWAVLVATALVEVPAAVRGRSSHRLRFAGPLQPLVGHLLAAVIVAAIAVAPRPGPATTPRPLAASIGSRCRPPVVAVGLVADFEPGAGPPSTNGDGPKPAGHALRTYVVQRNDTLWGIAERELGDPLRWSEIYELNKGRPEPGGRVLDDPQWIYAGWTLLLPVPSHGAAAKPPDHDASHGVSSPGATTRPRAARPAATSPRRPPGAPLGHSPAGDGHRAPAPNQGGHVANGRWQPPVSLPSGSVVAGSFAAGVLSALVLGRLRRRHGYRPSPPAPGRSLAPPMLRPTLRHLVEAVSRADDVDGNLATFDEPLPVLAGDDPERREQPDLIEVGLRAGEPVHLALGELGSVTLAGPGADDVVRSWATATLVRAGPHAAEVLTTSAELDLLAPGTGPVPGMRVVADDEALLRVVEVEVVARTRRLDRAELPNALAYRCAHPEDPFPSLLAITGHVAPGSVPRWRAMLGDAARLGICLVFPHGSDTASVRLRLDDGHIVSDARPEGAAGNLKGARLFTLTPQEAADVLVTLAAAEPRPSDGDDTDETAPTVASSALPAPEPWPEVPLPADDTEPPISLSLLGPFQLRVRGDVVRSGLRSVAKELLAWYALRPEGASVEAAVDALWPDTDPKLVHRQFWTAAANLRSRLRQAADTEVTVLLQEGDVYRLDPGEIGCDLWTFEEALRTASRAEDEATARDALRAAIDAYRGDFAEGVDWPWVEPVRADLHRRALDAHLRLAELEDALGAPLAAEAVLERAIELDRYAEEPYRRLMTLQARRGGQDTLRATWRLLQRRLADIDVDPETTTQRLFCSLTATTDPPAATPGRKSRARVP